MFLETGSERGDFVLAVNASPWPATVKNHLKTPLGSSASGEKKFTFAWTSLLSYLFPGPDYSICSSPYREGGISRAGADREADFGAHLPVDLSGHATDEFQIHSMDNFMAACVELKSPARLGRRSARIEADNQVRKRALDLYTSWFHPELLEERRDALRGFRKVYFISAFGYQAKVYELRTETFEVLPHAIVTSKPRVVEDLAPINEWNVDILTPDGARTLRAIAEHTHQSALASNLLENHPENYFANWNAYLPCIPRTTGVSMRPDQVTATPTTDSPTSTTASSSFYDPANSPRDRRRETGYRSTPPMTRSLMRSTGASTRDTSPMDPFLAVQTDRSPSWSGIQGPITPDRNYGSPNSMAYYSPGPSPNLSPETASYRAGFQARGQALLPPFQRRTREHRGNDGSDEDMDTDMEFSV